MQAGANLESPANWREENLKGPTWIEDSMVSWDSLRTPWRYYISRLSWESLGVTPDKLEEMAGEREIWASQTASG